MRSTAHSPPRGRSRHPSRRPQFEEVETSDSLAFSPSLSHGGPRVRILLPPAGSQVRTRVCGNKLGGCESADHPKLSKQAEEEYCLRPPVWFRLCRLRITSSLGVR